MPDGSSRSFNCKNVPYAEKRVFLINLCFRLFICHGCLLYGIYLSWTSASLMTTLFALMYSCMLLMGITAGCHRLWAHRSYKARFPLRVFLMCLCSGAGQYSILTWCRWHRVHHKFSDTNADPHNRNRGFMFAHFSWLLHKEHPEATEQINIIPLDDLWMDPIVRFQARFYVPMMLIFSLCLPSFVPVWFWQENIWNSIIIAGLGRYALTLEQTIVINSFGHTFGDRPLDKTILPTENAILSFITLGEGWHNYHHTFPWDYACSELGYYLNPTKYFIDLMACIGLAYNLKKATNESVRRRKLITGDGSRSDLEN